MNSERIIEFPKLWNILVLTTEVLKTVSPLEHAYSYFNSVDQGLAVEIKEVYTVEQKSLKTFVKVVIIFVPFHRQMHC